MALGHYENGGESLDSLPSFFYGVLMAKRRMSILEKAREYSDVEQELSARQRVVLAKAPQKGKQKAGQTAKDINEPIFMALLKSVGLPVPVKEYRIDPNRKFHADYAWPSIKLSVEINGGVFTKGAHGSITGILDGYKKINHLATQGWHIMIYVPGEMLKSSTADQIKEAYKCLTEDQQRG